MDFDMTKKLVIVGGGPAGLAAALEANRNGIAPDDILIIERDREVGGILNQCVHNGFGLHYFKAEECRFLISFIQWVMIFVCREIMKWTSA